MVCSHVCLCACVPSVRGAEITESACECWEPTALCSVQPSLLLLPLRCFRSRVSILSNLHELHEIILIKNHPPPSLARHNPMSFVSWSLIHGGHRSGWAHIRQPLPFLLTSLSCCCQEFHDEENYTHVEHEISYEALDLKLMFQEDCRMSAPLIERNSIQEALLVSPQELTNQIAWACFVMLSCPVLEPWDYGTCLSSSM